MPTTPRASHPVMLPEAGYDVGTLIGKGGMGEVVSAHDRRIGRDVAIKRMRAVDPSEEAIRQFLREARIQARLDHPAIVPVHELGVDPDGRPYFTMKRLAGVTLAQRIEEAVAMKRLLRAFCDVCLAVEFAHQRGVVHRDLKPANIMLGDYGEVYVLDWGIAWEAVDTLDGGTQTGELLGTPGYMAPEQVRGLAAGPATDVYALGSILFEILTGEPLHPRGAKALATTLAKPQQSPRQRLADNLAPELDLACVAALAEDPDQRPTARQLGERIQTYLDGDRDLERRRTLAKDELAIARAAYDSQDPEQRATAMHAAGRALALHPESKDASTLVTALIVEPARELPKELAAELAASDVDEAKRRARLSAAALVGVLGVLVVLPWMTVRSWQTFVLTLGTLVAAIGYIAWSSRRGYVGAKRVLLVTLAVTLAFSRVLGPFMLTPVITAGSLFAMCSNPWVRARRSIVYGWLVVATALPLLLERIGWFAPTVDVVNGAVCATSPIFAGQGLPDMVALVVSNFALLFAMSNFAIATNRQITEARHELRVQAWHLGRLLPEDIR